MAEVWHGPRALKIALVILMSAVLFAHDAEGNASAAPPPLEERAAETPLVETMSDPEGAPETDVFYQYVESAADSGIQQTSKDDWLDETQFLAAPEAKKAANTTSPLEALREGAKATAKDLDALKKNVAAKAKTSQARLKAQSAALEKKLAADKIKLKAAQAKAAQNAVSAGKAAKNKDTVVGPKLLSTITKLQRKLKTVVAENEKDLAAKVASVKNEYEEKLKDLNNKLQQEKRRQGRTVKKLDKDRAKTEKAKAGVKDMEARKNARKKQYRESRRLVRSLTDVTKRLKNKLVKETAARKKAEASALLLSQRIKKMSHFGKKAAKFAKKQAVKAASIKKKAAQDTAKLLAKHAKLEGKAKEFQARKESIKQQLAKMRANKLAAEAKALHEKTERHKLNVRLLALHQNLTHAQHHAQRLKHKVVKHKKIAKKATKKVLELKEEAHKAVLALRKVNAIRMALGEAKKEVLHYKQENKLQRMELAQAAVEELKAANVTKLAARHAEAMEEHALRQRNLERKIVKEAQLQVSKGHGDLKKVRAFAKNLVAQAKLQLVQEHNLRITAEDAKAQAHTNVEQLKVALQQEHEKRLKEEATSRELRADRDHLLAREKAEARMIAIEKEATEESKLALVNFKKAAQRREAEIKARFQAALAKEEGKLAEVKTNAATVSARSQALQKAVQVEKEVLTADHVKQAKERASWQEAMAAMNKERVARTVAKERAEGTSRDLAAKAEKEVGVATTLASGKEAEVAQLRAQMKSQAEKFAQASKDWGSVKAGLETGVEQAQEAASVANAKLAEYMKRREEDTTGAVAAGSVKAAMAKAEKAEAAKAAAKDVMALLQQEKLEHGAREAEGRFAEEVPPELESVAALPLA